MQARVIVKDKTHDPFIVFGGLFSRKLITSHLDSIESEDDVFTLCQDLKAFISSGKISEERLRHKIAQTVLRGVFSHLPSHSRGDIFYQDVVFEVKNNPNELDVEVIKGSIDAKKTKRKETAVEELFRYLSGKNAKDWGVLTTGRVYRIYHKSNEEQFIEFDLFDIIDSGSLNHLYLLRKILLNSEFRNQLLEETREIREVQSRENLVGQFFGLLTEKERSDRAKAYPKLVTFLSLLSIRYLEDAGIMPVLAKDYNNFSLRENSHWSKSKLLKIINKYLSGDWFNGNEQKLLSKDELSLIEDTLSSEAFVNKLKKAFLNYDDFDYSDIFIDQLGGVYQEIVNKNSEGAYYTPYSIGRKIAGYLKNINETQKIHFESNHSKVIVDIACGSGQLLRALIPYGHLFFKNKSGYLGKNSLRREMISRLVGIDKDPNSVFICKLSLALFGAEIGLGLSMPRLTKEEDTFEAFCDSRSNFLEIDRKDIFSIVTNPPWESLEFNVSMLYRKVTGNKLPKKSNKSAEANRQRQEFAKWEKSNSKLIAEEEKRVADLKDMCEKVSAEHSEYFSGKKNTALYFYFIVQKIVEQSGGSYVVVMPDRFLIGDTTPVRDKLFHEIDGYIPFQNCGSIFDGVDKGTRFGIVFSRANKKKTLGNLFLQIPIMENLIPVDFITKKVSKSDLVQGDETILPFFQTSEDYELFNCWFRNRTPLDSWGQGKLNLGARSAKDEFEIGGKGKYTYNVVKSEKRVSSKNDQFFGIFHTPFGATIKEVTDRLEKHYKEEKLIVPNVKRNGIRKILASCEKNCIVEHDYNFNSELKACSLPIIRSFVYNSVANCLAGSYHINASLLNQLGVVPFDLTKYEKFNFEIELLKAMGLPELDALQIFFRSVLVGYDDSIKQQAIDELSEVYTDSFRHLDLSYDESYVAILAQRSLFDTDKAKVFDIDKTTNLSGYIVSTLKNDKNFGRVKFAKVLYLTQHLCDVDLGIDWQRKAAGPYNDKDLRKVEKKLEKEHGIYSETKQIQKKKYVKYKSENRLKANEFIEDFEKNKQKTIKDWVKWFKPFTTERMELIATIFAAWNDMLIKGEEVTMKKIINEVRNNWTPSKLKFSESKIRQEVNFMKQNDIIPKGFGYSTLAS